MDKNKTQAFSEKTYASAEFAAMIRMICGTPKMIQDDMMALSQALGIADRVTMAMKDREMSGRVKRAVRETIVELRNSATQLEVIMNHWAESGGEERATDLERLKMQMNEMSVVAPLPFIRKGKGGEK